MFIEEGLHIAQTSQSSFRRKRVDALIGIARSAGYTTFTLGSVRDVIASSDENLQHFASTVWALVEFWITKTEIKTAGGRQTIIASNLDALLTSYGFKTEIKCVAPMAVYRDEETTVSFDDRFAHRLDGIIGRLALEFQWNSKDIAFYRDIFSFNRLHRSGTIDFAVLITRSTELKHMFKSLGVTRKYGASTTHHSKLIPALIEDAKQPGCCPTVVFAITDLRVVD